MDTTTAQPQATTTAVEPVQVDAQPTTELAEAPKVSEDQSQKPGESTVAGVDTSAAEKTEADSTTAATGIFHSVQSFCYRAVAMSMLFDQ